jgi:hypothetical protein
MRDNAPSRTPLAADVLAREMTFDEPQGRDDGLNQSSDGEDAEGLSAVLLQWSG